MSETHVIRSVSEVMPTACEVLARVTNYSWRKILKGIWSFHSLDISKEWDGKGMRSIFFEFRVGRGKDQVCYSVSVYATLVEDEWQPYEANVIMFLHHGDCRVLARFQIEPTTGRITKCLWQRPAD